MGRREQGLGRAEQLAGAACLAAVGGDLAQPGASAMPGRPRSCRATVWRIREMSVSVSSEMNAAPSANWSATARAAARARAIRSGWPARPGAIGMVLREPAGPQEGLPHQDLLVVDALEHADGSPQC
jgi:hypothetical protein